MPRIIMNRAFIARWTRMPHSTGRLSASASSHHSLSSATFITNIAESDFRHAQGAIGHGALHHVGNWGRRSRFETWLCPGYPRWEGLYLRLTLSERLRSAWSQPRLSLTGRENRSEPALAGYQH